MSVSVALEFALPGQPDIISISIYEAPDEVGPYELIETVEDVGAWPGYINNYTTNAASSADDWFAISWTDAKGAVSELSQPIKGNTQSIVSLITERVMQRGATALESVVVQEAEAVSELFFGKNPYEVELPVSYAVLSGLTYLTLARSMIAEVALGGESSGWTAGIVSMKNDSGSNQKILEWLLDQANNLLGLNLSVVMLLEDFDPTGIGTRSAVNWDQSRLALTVNFE